MKINKNNYFLFLYICVPFVATAFIELNKILTFSTVIFITLLFLFKKLSSKIIINNQYFEKFNKTNIGFLIFFQGLSSIPLGKNKKIQALVKCYVFLTQKVECNSASRGQMWTKLGGHSFQCPPGPF